MTERERLEMLIAGNEDSAGIYRDEARDLKIWVCYIILFFVVFVFSANQKKREEAQLKETKAQIIHQYIENTYGDKFDIFKESAVHVTNYDGEGIKTTILYSVPHHNGRSFSIKADPDGNIVYDGYKNYYINGGTLFSRCDDLITREGMELDKEFYALAIEKERMSLLENVDLYFKTQDDVWYYEEASKHTYKGPVLDVNQTPSVDIIPTELKYIELTMKTVKKTPEEFKKLVIFFRDYIAGKDIAYSYAEITMDPKASFKKYTITLTKEEIESDAFLTILNTKEFG